MSSGYSVTGRALIALTLRSRLRLSSGLFNALRRTSETMVGGFVASFRTSEAMALMFVTLRWIVEVVAFLSTASSFWDWKVSSLLHSNDSTYIKDLENTVEVHLPIGYRLSVAPRVKASRDCIPLTPLDQPSSNVRHGPAIESILMASSKFMSPVQLTMPIDLSPQTRVG